MSPPVSPLDTTDCEAELRTFLFTVCRIYARTLTSTPLCCVSVFVLLTYKGTKNETRK